MEQGKQHEQQHEQRQQEVKSGHHELDRSMPSGRSDSRPQLTAGEDGELTVLSPAAGSAGRTVEPWSRSGGCGAAARSRSSRAALLQAVVDTRQSCVAEGTKNSKRTRCTGDAASIGDEASTHKVRWKFNVGSQRWTRESKPLAPSSSVGDDTAWWDEVERSIELGDNHAEPERFAMHVITETFNYGGKEVEGEGNAKRARRSQPGDDADAEDEWWLEVDPIADKSNLPASSGERPYDRTEG